MKREDTTDARREAVMVVAKITKDGEVKTDLHAPRGIAPAKERVPAFMVFRSSWTGTPGVGLATYGD